MTAAVNQTATVATENQTAAVATENQTAPAYALTKQEILRNALVAAPINAKYGTADHRIATVELVGTLYVAKYNDIDVAAIKKAEVLANHLIDKRPTNKAQWANVAELNFLCDVPEGTPNRAGMKKAGGKLVALQAAIQAEIPTNLEKSNKAELIAALTKIAELTSAAE